MERKSLYTAGLLLLTSAGGYMWYENKSIEDLKLSSCFESKRLAQISYDSTQNAILDFTDAIEVFEQDIENSKNKISSFKEQAINLESQIPAIEAQLRQTTLTRESAASELCFLSKCVERRAATVARLDAAIYAFNETIASYNAEINKIRQISILDEEARIIKLNEEKITIEKSRKELERKANQYQSLLNIQCQ